MASTKISKEFALKLQLAYYLFIRSDDVTLALKVRQKWSKHHKVLSNKINKNIYKK